VRQFEADSGKRPQMLTSQDGDVPPAEFEALTPPRVEAITSTIMSKEPN
jgi:hypothetical protein